MSLWKFDEVLKLTSMSTEQCILSRYHSVLLPLYIIKWRACKLDADGLFWNVPRMCSAFSVDNLPCCTRFRQRSSGKCAVQRCEDVAEDWPSFGCTYHSIPVPTRFREAENRYAVGWKCSESLRWVLGFSVGRSLAPYWSRSFVRSLAPELWRPLVLFYIICHSCFHLRRWHRRAILLDWGNGSVVNRLNPFGKKRWKNLKKKRNIPNYLHFDNHRHWRKNNENKLTFA